MIWKKVLYPWSQKCIWKLPLMSLMWRANTRPSSETHAKFPWGTVWPPTRARLCYGRQVRAGRGPRARPRGSQAQASELGTSGVQEQIRPGLNTLYSSLSVQRQKPVPWKAKHYEGKQCCGRQPLIAHTTPKVIALTPASGTEELGGNVSVLTVPEILYNAGTDLCRR